MNTYAVKHIKRIQIARLTIVGTPHHQALYVMRRSKGRTLYRPDGIAEVIDLVPTNTLAAIGRPHQIWDAMQACWGTGHVLPFPVV